LSFDGATVSMRIALNHTRFGAAGGVEGYLRRLVDFLNRKGWEIHLFARKADIPRGVEMIFHRVPCLPFPQPLRILSFAYRSARLLAREKFDLTFGFGRTFGHDIHRDSSGAFEPFAAAVADTLSRSSFYRRAVSHLERRLYASKDLLHTLAVSRFVKDQITSRYPIPEERISVVYNGVDHSSFSPENRASRGARLRSETGVSEETPVALFVGNDWRRKGLLAALEGIARASSPWELWVVGEERRRRFFDDLVRRSGLSKRVRFFGRRPTVEFYAAADALLFPSLFDPLSNVVLEAMASALPVIVSPTDGAHELVEPGENGFVLRDSRSGAEIAAFLDRLKDRRVRRTMGVKAAEKVRPLTWENHFRKLEGILEAARREKAARRSKGPLSPEADSRRRPR